VEILAISGGLTSRSSDTRLLANTRALVDPPLAVTCYDELGHLPPFHPDIGHPPAVVERLWARLDAADGLLLSSPPDGGEIAGPLQNALDWAGSDGSLFPVPVAVLNTSIALDAPSSHAALLLALTKLGARVVSPACLSIPTDETAFDEDDVLVDQFAVSALRLALAVLVNAIADEEG
jgi:chromate reductase, NAD(P)H dehydrogenase (quinone)